MRKDNFIYLLVALQVYLVLLPILEHFQLLSEALIRPIAITCLLAIGVWSLRDSKRIFRIGMALVVTGIASNSLAAIQNSNAFQYLAITTLFVFLLLAIWNALRQVMFGTEMNANRLFGAVCIYLMLGVNWALMYGGLHMMDPDSFSGALGSNASDAGGDWIYYSFVTLTTLGYGDILPVSSIARALAYSQAIVGVFYMAVLVAALVSTYAAEKRHDV